MRNVLLAVLIVAGLWNAVLAQENYSLWASSRDVILNTKASGANVTTTQVNFPVLIRLTASDSAIFTGALANGADIRFAKFSGKHLPYQIEQWNAATKTAAIWVLVDTVKGSDSVASVKMFWGKSGAADSAKASAVFDTANGFQAVWHLGEATGATSNDATINAFAGTPSGTTTPVDSIGMIGSAKYFNGTTSYIDFVGTAGSKLNFVTNGIYTVSAWMYPNDTLNRYVVSKGDGDYSVYFRSAGHLAFVEVNTTRQWVDCSPQGMKSRWIHVAGVRNGTAMTMYVDGAVPSSLISSTGSTARNTTFNVQIGKIASSAANFFSGKIDEVQIANVARSADWVKLSFESQKAAQTLVTLGAITATVTPPVAPVLSLPANAAVNVAVLPTLTWGTVIGAVTYQVQVSTISTFASTVADDATLTAGTKTLAVSLSGSTTYFWRASASNNGGMSPWSAAWSFTTVATIPSPPVTPVLTAPANAATNVALAPSLTWGTVSNAATYRVQVATTSTFATTIADDSTLTAGTKNITGLSNSIAYFWRVNAKNAGGTSAWSAPWSFTTLSATSYKTKNVIIYVVDGSRYIETMGDTVGIGIGGGHANIPYLWNILRPLGTLFTKMYCGGNNNTETCPGHASIVTGSWQNITNDGLERPHTPTIFEYYRKQKGAPANDCFYVGGKTKLNILQYSDSVGYGATYGANALIPAANRQYHDTTAWSNLKTVMNTYHPKLSIINMAQTDSVGHAGVGNEGSGNATFVRYLGAIKQADSIAYKLWAAIQADSVYKDKTTLIITNDHGRHTTSLTGWISHGDQCDGCKHIMSLVIGPDTRANKVDSTTVQQIDYAPTIAKLMGFTTPNAAGSLLQSVLLPPTQNLPKESGVVQNTKSYGISKITSNNNLVKIEFAVPVSGQVSLKLFDLAGRECATMIQGNLAAGSHSVSVNTVSIANGAYVLRLTGTFGSMSQKMLVGR